MANWDRRFIGVAQLYASWSKDPSTKVGCVIVNPRTRTEVAAGFNGFPRGVREEAPLGTKFVGVLEPLHLDPTRWARPTKYSFAEHAERNAIYNAARLGHATEGCWAYLSVSPAEICADCARALIQAGIKQVLGPENLDVVPPGDDWRATCEFAMEMFMEAGVVLTTLPAHHE